DGEERSIGHEGLDEEKHEIRDHEERDAPEDLDIEDGEKAEGPGEDAVAAAQDHKKEGKQESGDATDGGQRQGRSHRLQQQGQMSPGEEARNLVDDRQHQKIFALTRKAQRPTRASDRLAMKVSTT